MAREIININKGWKFSECFEMNQISKEYDDSSFETVFLPHTNKEIPYNYFDEKMYQFVSCYRREIEISKEHKDKCIFVDFDAVMTYAEVYFNGELVGSHKGGYTPFSVDLTGKYDFDGKNVLAVKVDSTERNDIPPFGNLIDYLTYGGIYRDVSLRLVDKIHIDNGFARTGDVLLDLKKLDISVFVNNRAGSEQTVELSVSLNKDGVLLYQKQISAALKDHGPEEVKVLFEGLQGIELWDIRNPCLYDVEAAIIKDGGIIDNYRARIGFREAKVTAEGFYLNGRKIKLRGLNRHQSYPYVGYAMPERAQKKDADILKKELHINIVRTSHYPQSKYFLDRCDEIGLLVLEEIPGWQYIGDEGWKQVAYDNVREMITRDWNHPAIILWGVRINESADDHDFYTKTNQIAHSLDATRQTCGIRNLWNSELLEDVYTINDFSQKERPEILQEQKTVTGLKEYVPYLVTEFNGHMFPTKRFDEEGRLAEHALRHYRVHNAAGVDEHISGAIGWCAFDYNTHFDFGSGDRICYHGVMDMFRIPKFAAYAYKSQVDPGDEVVLEPLTLWARGEKDMSKVTPLVIATNCDYIDLFVAEKEMGRFYPAFEEFPGIAHPPVIIKAFDCGDWGYKWDDAEITGYIGGEPAATKKFCKNPIVSGLDMKADDDSLKADGMDATRIVIKLVDQLGNLIPYVNDFVRLSISGPGEIIGPKEVSLIGGCIGAWVKTKEESGEIVLNVVSARAGQKEVRIRVE